MYDVCVLGGGAAGLFCAGLLGQAGLSVLVLEKANKVGKKILMSGGGRCNFTNLNIQFDCYLSNNPHFCKSALSRYTQWDFINLVEKYKIAYFEKTLGQLFCQGKARQIVDMLLAECQKGKVSIRTKQTIESVDSTEESFQISTENDLYQARYLVNACGGLSIPTLGGSPFGYQLAEQFGHDIVPTRAGLVPFTSHVADKERFADLSGVSLPVTVKTTKQSFSEDLLFTHRGLSGPAILQISSYWQPGESVDINTLPQKDITSLLESQFETNPKVKNVLQQHIPKRVLNTLVSTRLLNLPVKQLSPNDYKELKQLLQHWQYKPNATEGYRTAEVTLGGVDVNQVNSKTMQSQKHANLYLIGEVLDVTGWLGGYNFQWAWASAYACAAALKERGRLSVDLC